MNVVGHDRPCISVRGLDKTFTLHQQGGIQLAVLADTALDVFAGDCLALTGPSGAGKSTLLRCLYGNYQPTHGSIWIRHLGAPVDLCRTDAREVIEIRRRTIGWVSQFLRVIPRVSSLDIVAEPVIALGVSKDEARTRAADLLTRLHVPERLWSLAPATFSGGEQQRVNVAHGLAASHPILLVDEPTASLDPRNRDVVVELLHEARSRGTAIVGIFHDDAVRSLVATTEYEVANTSRS